MTRVHVPLPDMCKRLTESEDKHKSSGLQLTFILIINSFLDYFPYETISCLWGGDFMGCYQHRLLVIKDTDNR